MSEVISSFKSLRAGSQVFALLMLFPCVFVSCDCDACTVVCVACVYAERV